MLSSAVAELIRKFVIELVVTIERDAATKALEIIQAAMGTQPEQPFAEVVAEEDANDDFPESLLEDSAPKAVRKLRKKPPKQFCPVPGCKNVAAPIFGMVCKDHKNVAKSKLDKYRAERKAAKLAAKGGAKKSIVLAFDEKKKTWKGTTKKAKALSAPKAKPAKTKATKTAKTKASKTTKDKPTKKPTSVALKQTVAKSAKVKAKKDTKKLVSKVKAPVVKPVPVVIDSRYPGEE